MLRPRGAGAGFVRLRGAAIARWCGRARGAARLCSRYVRVFDPQPAARELPARFPSPFATEPHALARRAAEELVRELRAGLAATAGLDAPGGGKMFGVLVCQRDGDDDGPIGYLRAFSGMLGGRWRVAGFAPPVFDEAARDAWWPASEAELAVLEAQRAAIADGAVAVAARAELAAVIARHAAEAAELRARHATNRTARHAARAGAPDPRALDQLSRADTADKRELRARHAAERALATARVTTLAADADALAGRRAARSRDFLARIHAGYVLTSARGETRALGELFAPDAPPGGAGDCAAPKLLAEAQRRRLRPLALAEVWWGAPPATGGRHAGAYYPACRGKCGPLLPFLLAGLATDDAPQFGGGPIAAAEPRTLYEDAWLVVVAKPCGLLSVPGRGGALRDSVLARLRARDPGATGPLVVHRLDLDTSGVLLAARDAATHTALQAQFARREVTKHYVAWLDGTVAGEAGTIELPLRVDLDDRPRQIVDPSHGKPALTAWRVLSRAAGRTRVALSPLTGRTHQLRVHCAHALGLAAPITGDRLYGRPAAEGARLELHAEAIAFTHPHTGARVEVAWPAPF